MKAFERFEAGQCKVAYNVGMSGISRRSKEQKTNNYYDLLLPNETSRYIFRLLAIKEIFENKSVYGFVTRKSDLYKYPSIRKIEISKSNIDLVTLSDSLGVNYKILKQYNPWLKDKKLTNNSNKTYIITLPVLNDTYIFKNK